MENNQFFFVVVYSNEIVKHGNEGVIFESNKTVMLRTNRLNTLHALKTIMFSNIGGIGTKEVGRIAYKFLHALPNGGFTNRLFWIDRDQHMRVMFDIHARLMPQHVMELYAAIRDVVVGAELSPSSLEIVPLEATLIHYAQPYYSADEYNSEGYSTYVAGSRSSSDTASTDEYVPETPTGSVGQFFMPPPLAIPRLSEHTPILAPTISQDHAQLDSSLICRVVLPMIKTEPSVSIPVLQSAVHQSYHFKPSYQNVWMAKKKGGHIYSRRLLAAIEKNIESLPIMRVTHCDHRAFVFSVEEVEPVDGWSQTSYRVCLNARTCDRGLFQSLYYPCRHALAACVAESIEWGNLVDPVYKMASVFKFLPIPDEKIWLTWYGARLKPNPVVRQKAMERPVSTRLWNEMDAFERIEKRCGFCQGKQHTKRGCPNAPQSDLNGVQSHFHEDESPSKDRLAEDEHLGGSQWRVFVVVVVVEELLHI
ncbi:hypothetical protein Ahy_A08g040232 [Arachis hypogaea]|uniref:Zinc finger PMZ-type domain-containing protein n=1 Tax=Arachis hypogaea TaxID=3818 RepID=A0A445BYJ6_ARAHY|nr:hypothetical protein Ahy_A08g040232 [Arachis hypogaea]